MTTKEREELGQRAWQAFERDLPKLWEERPGQFVAYHGEQILGFAKHKHEIYQDCMRGGYSPDEIVVFCIEAQLDEMWLSPDIRD